MKEKGRKRHTERGEGKRRGVRERTRIHTQACIRLIQDRIEKVRYHVQNEDMKMRVRGIAGVPIAASANSLA